MYTMYNQYATGGHNYGSLFGSPSTGNGGGVGGSIGGISDKSAMVGSFLQAPPSQAVATVASSMAFPNADPASAAAGALAGDYLYKGNVGFSGVAASAKPAMEQLLPSPYTLAASYPMAAAAAAASAAAASAVTKTITATLDNDALWKRFNRIGTEMIITKTGRRMFPALRLRLHGLAPEKKYVLAVEMWPADENRYKYHKSQWVVIGKAEPHLNSRWYIHPDSPAPGSYWMKRAVSFHKLKLTNNNLDQNGYTILNSMHRYIPRIHVLEANHTLAVSWGWNTLSCSFSFPETVFTAVTAYQNERITRLKIEHNPFAKSFRHNGKGRRHAEPKRTQQLDVRKPAPTTGHNTTTDKCSGDSGSGQPKKAPLLKSDAALDTSSRLVANYFNETIPPQPPALLGGLLQSPPPPAPLLSAADNVALSSSPPSTSTGLLDLWAPTTSSATSTVLTATH